MDAQRKQLLEHVSRFLGYIYLLPPCNHCPHHAPHESNASCSAPSSSTLMPHRSRAILMDFACLIGEAGQSLVPFTPLMQAVHSSEYTFKPHLIVEFPRYDVNNPLSFSVRMALHTPGCEVCIVEPVNCIPALPTRINLCLHDENLQPGDAVFCFNYPEFTFEHRRLLPSMVEGAVSLPPHSSYGLIAAFGIYIDMYGGVVTNLAGEIVASHCCNFTVEEGDVVCGAEKRSNVSKIVMIKDTTDKGSGKPNSKTGFPRMPLSLLTHVQHRFATSGLRRKQKSEQSRLYPISLVRRQLLEDVEPNLELTLGSVLVQDDLRLIKRQRLNSCANNPPQLILVDDNNDEAECVNIVLSPPPSDKQDASSS